MLLLTPGEATVLAVLAPCAHQRVAEELRDVLRSVRTWIRMHDMQTDQNSWIREDRVAYLRRHGLAASPAPARHVFSTRLSHDEFCRAGRRWTRNGMNAAHKPAGERRVQATRE